MATTITSGVQYSGIWTMQQVNAAVAAGTWPSPTAPRLYSWGQNTYGQLGLRNTTNYSSPKQVGVLTTWAILSVGRAFSIATKSDGTLWSWGRNNKGQLGLGNITSYSSPVQVGALTSWLNVVAGYDHAVATKTNGTLWAWGNNNLGGLGLGDTTNRSSPTQVGALTTWLSIAAGYSSVLAVKTDGTLWSWGNNLRGGLGLGNITYYSSPKQVGALTNWSTVSTTQSPNDSSAAVKTDGSVWAWGYNSSGQLGRGNTTDISSPQQVGALTNWAKIVITNFCTATKTDGTLWAWGYNVHGELGQGNTTAISSPVQVGALTTWLNIAASYQSSAFSIKTDGTLWSWGRNTDAGQLGLGDATNRSSPVQIGSLTSWSKVATGGFQSLAIATA